MRALAPLRDEPTGWCERCERRRPAPDKDLGERIVAWVVADEAARAPAAEELADHVARELAPHKRPRDVHFVDELPRNAMGKVVKGRLAD